MSSQANSGSAGGNQPVPPATPPQPSSTQAASTGAGSRGQSRADRRLAWANPIVEIVVAIAAAITTILVTNTQSHNATDTARMQIEANDRTQAREFLRSERRGVYTRYYASKERFGKATEAVVVLFTPETPWPFVPPKAITDEFVAARDEFAMILVELRLVGSPEIRDYGQRMVTNMNLTSEAIDKGLKYAAGDESLRAEFVPLLERAKREAVDPGDPWEFFDLARRDLDASDHPN